MKSITLLIILVALAFQLKAKDVDMTFNIDFGDTSNLIIGQEYSYSIEFINNSSEDAGIETNSEYTIATIASNVPENDNGEPELFFYNSNYPECRLALQISHPPPGQTDIFYGFVFETSLVPANSSVICRGNYQIGFKQGQRLINFSIFSYQDNELNINDNLLDILFGVRPQIIPTFSSLTKYLLAIMFLIIIFSKNKFITSRLK
jgi:hypothetical protein